MIDRFGGERLPAIDLAQQGPEQHGGGVGLRQHGLRLDPPLELLVPARRDHTIKPAGRTDRTLRLSR